MKKTSVQSNINLETLAGGAFAENDARHAGRCCDDSEKESFCCFGGAF